MWKRIVNLNCVWNLLIEFDVFSIYNKERITDSQWVMIKLQRIVGCTCGWDLCDHQDENFNILI